MLSTTLATYIDVPSPPSIASPGTILVVLTTSILVAPDAYDPTTTGVTTVPPLPAVPVTCVPTLIFE